MSEAEKTIPPDLMPLVDLASLEQRFETEGGSDQVEKLLQAALADHPDHGVPKAAWAWYLSKNEDYVGAVKWLTHAVEAGPESMLVPWTTRRAGYWFRIGDWRMGFQDFAKAISAAPEEAFPLLARSFEMRMMGDYVSGDLDEKIAMFMMGRLDLGELITYIRQLSPFLSPGSLEASLLVMSDPLDPTARIYRGEMFAAMGSPSAAFYDLHFANILKPMNLGLMARLEDIRVKGILADPPLYETKKPDLELRPIYARVLGEYERFIDSQVIEPRRGVKIGWIEKIFGRCNADQPFDLTTTSRNLVIAGMGMGLAAICMIAAFAVIADRIEKNKNALFGPDFDWVPAVLWGVEVGVLTIVTFAGIAGSLIATTGVIQLTSRCRIAELSGVLLSKRWYLRPLILYAFILIIPAVIILTMGVNLLIFFFLLETIQAASAQLRTIIG